MSLQHNVQYEALFRIPGGPETFYGNFSIENREVIGVFLNVPKSLRIQSSFGFEVFRTHIPVIHINFVDKRGTEQHATLFETQLGSHRVSEIAEASFYSQYLILGELLDSIQFVIIKEVIMTPGFINQWVLNSEIQTNKYKDGISLKYINREPKVLFEDDNAQVRLNFSASTHWNRYTASITQKTQVQVKLNSTVNLAGAFDLVDQVRKLFTLLINASIPIDDIHLKLAIDQNYVQIFRSDNRTYSREGKMKAQMIPFTLNELNNYSSIITNWFLLSEGLTVLTNRYLELVNNNQLYTHVSFQSLVGIIEGFAKKSEAKLKWSKNVKRHLDRVPDQNSREFFRSLLAQRDQVTLLNKFLSVLDNKKFVTELITDDLNRFCKRVVETRHWYTHPLLTKKKEVISEKELSLYERTLRLTVYCLILLELGMDEDYMIKRLKPRTVNTYISYGGLPPLARILKS